MKHFRERMYLQGSKSALKCAKFSSLLSNGRNNMIGEAKKELGVIWFEEWRDINRVGRQIIFLRKKNLMKGEFIRWGDTLSGDVIKRSRIAFFLFANFPFTGLNKI